MLEEGINEAGSTCSWIAAATSYANHGISMVPFYIYYSMFGFQRVGDFIWAAGDMRARGFLLGATAGRTTLAGEGLQHQDGHSQLVATTVPNCRAYDPTFAYELAVIIQDGMQRMYVENESVFYYISVMNENYPQPAMPAGVEAGIVKGGYLLRTGAPAASVRATLLGSGTILRECIAAAELLREAVRRHAPTCSRSPASASCVAKRSSASAGTCCIRATQPRVPYVQTLLGGREGPLVAATDYVRNVPDQIRPWVSRRTSALGTDGFGRSDARAELRRAFRSRSQLHRTGGAQVARRCRADRPPESWSRRCRHSASIRTRPILSTA